MINRKILLMLGFIQPMMYYGDSKPKISEEMQTYLSKLISGEFVTQQIAKRKSDIPQIVVLLGGPGSGKDYTLAKMRKNIPNFDDHIAVFEVGNQLRNLELFNDALAKGQMINNQIVYVIAIDNIIKAIDDNKKLVIFNGFPRTAEQLNWAKNLLNLQTFWQLDVPESEIYTRITNRLVHLPSGRTYNTVTNPPKREGLDDITGEKLVKRSDDTIEVVKSRLAKFYNNNEEMKKLILDSSTLSPDSNVRWLVMSNSANQFDGNEEVNLEYNLTYFFLLLRRSFEVYPPFKFSENIKIDDMFMQDDNGEIVKTSINKESFKTQLVETKAKLLEAIKIQAKSEKNDLLKQAYDLLIKS